MPKYRFTDSYARVYFDRRTPVEPGEVVEADENPDPLRFEEIAEPKSGKATQPSTEPEETA